MRTVAVSGSIKSRGDFCDVFWGSGKIKSDDFCGVINQRSSMGRALITAVAAIFSLFGAVSVAATSPAVSPNQDFSNPILQVHAPPSNGWHGLSQTPNRIAFAKSGSTEEESFVAAVFLFRIPTFQNSEAFTEYVREAVIKDSPSERFETLESSVLYSTEREYPCVRYHGISIDRHARTSALFYKKLRIENIALYCEHPGPA